MPNNYLSVLYKHIIQGRAQTYHCPPPPPQSKMWGDKLALQSPSLNIQIAHISILELILLKQALQIQ